MARIYALGRKERYMVSFARVVLAVLLLASLGACTVGFDAGDEQYRFSCCSDSDCIPGFRCTNTEEDSCEDPGQCLSQSHFDRRECADRDNDGYLAGDDCEPGPPRDCNDDPDNGGAFVNPGQEESCNNIDDNCDDEIDNDIESVFCSLQFGVCAGSVSQCFEGQFLDCEEAGLYGESYQSTSSGPEVCDGLDNNCNDEVDEDCECEPGVVQACGEDLGICKRGIQVCADDYTFGPCVVAEEGAECETNDTCGESAFCVDEVTNPYESIDDECARRGDDACSRRVCRALATDLACEDAEGCAETEACVEGYCQQRVTSSENESCNGIDDDCDGRVDNFGSGVCDTCPFGMVFVSAVGGGSGRGFCIDAYEASRADATEESLGEIETFSTARAGVIPWTGLTPDEADEVCEASALRTAISGAVPQRFLCTQWELQTACENDYPYGDTYVADTCVEGGTDLALTGSLEQCCTASGICDLAGNAAEMFRQPFQGIQGGSVLDSGETAISCGGFERYGLTALDPSFMAFRCCMGVN